MKFLSVQFLVALMFISARTSGAAEPAATATTNAPAPGSVNGTPKIQFDSVIYDFGRVPAGELVKHEFVFTNVGTAPLEVTGVYPSCGCTTAGEWTHHVEPGKTGVIPLQFDSGRFPGQTVTKTATVISNDKTQPTLVLQIKGKIWVPVEVQPQAAVLNVISDSPSNAPVTVHITNNLSESITLSEPHSSNPAFAADLKTIRPGKEFQLVIRTVSPPPAANTSGVISMKTSSTNFPTVNVSAVAVVQPAVVVMPTEVTLAPRWGTNGPPPFTVVIRNNGANPLTLSEPKFSDAQVGVETKEVVPGRQFTLTMNFPPGFQIPPGSVDDLTVKTSHPRFPLIKIPVRELSPVPAPRVAPPPAPASH